MRIAHLVHSLRRGGAERVLLHLAIGMRRYQIEPLIISLLNVNEYRESPYCDLPVVSLIEANEYRWPWGIPQMARRLSGVANELQPDVLQIHSPTAAIVAAWAGSRIPSIQVFHGYSDMLTAEGFLKKRVLRGLRRWAFNRLENRGIVVSPSLINTVSEYMACPVNQIRCIVNGVDVEQFRFTERTLTLYPIIYVVGTLGEVKNTNHAIQAFALLQKEIPGARLRIVGEGPLRPKLEIMIAELGLADSVELLGRRSDVADLLSYGHLLWQLSRSEGLPLACIEAMASGLPIVGSNVRGIRDVVTHDVTGYLVPEGDIKTIAGHSVEVLSDFKKYRDFSLASRRAAESKFSQQRMCDQHARAILDAWHGGWVK